MEEGRFKEKLEKKKGKNERDDMWLLTLLELNGLILFSRSLFIWSIF